MFTLRVAAIACALFISDACADLPKVGIIDFYGLRSIKKEVVVEVLGIKAGDPIPVDFPSNVPEPELRKAFEIPPGAPLPPNTKELESRLGSIKGVTKVKLATVCCEADGTSTLFVGISESGGLDFYYKPEPAGQIKLPASVVDLYDRHLEALSDSVRRGTSGEDDSEGHALFKGEAIQPIQTEMI